MGPLVQYLTKFIDSILPRENLKNEVREALQRKTELTTKVHNDLVTKTPS